jgi:hypothetical protein
MTLPFPIFFGITYPSIPINSFMEHFIIISVVGSLLCLVFVFHIQLIHKYKFPSNVPWVGKDSSKLFAEGRTMISGFNNPRRWLAEGYEKVRPRKPK